MYKSQLIGGLMVKHDYIAVVSYTNDMTFEEIEHIEKGIRTSIESIFTRCNVEALSYASSENSFTIRCELIGILPLHLLRDIAKDITLYLSHGAECRMLVYSWNLGVIKGAVCKEGTYKMQSLDAVQSVGHRTMPFFHEETIHENKIFS